MIDSYLLVDREAETSIKFFALDLFTVPSVSAFLVQKKAIHSRILAVIAGFFTNQIANKRITFPPDTTATMDVEAYPFRSKRYMPIFSDIRYICNNHKVQTLISSDTVAITEFVSVCAMFMGIQPNKRARGNHVEYESDYWINVFNVTLSLSRVVKAFGEAFSASTTSALISCIGAVMSQILRVINMVEERLDRMQYFAPSFHAVSFNKATYHVIAFDVLTGWISFHNSPHWLLAELFKQIHLLEDKSVSENLSLPNLKSALAANFEPSAILRVIEFPLRGKNLWFILFLIY